MPKELIEIKNLVKIYPPETLAVNQVDLIIKEGEIHALIGENGAGKSTLMKVLYGMIPFNSGSIYLDNKKIDFKSPREAVQAGIGMVHQEFMLIHKYTIYENVILGVEPTAKFGLLKQKESKKRVQKIIDNYQLKLNPDDRIEDISVAARQKVEILKLLYRDVDILILDEPTAVLTPQEIEELFARLKSLKKAGKTIIFISHKLNEVLELADSVTVMRQGKKVATMTNEGLSKADLARAMVGRDVVFSIEKEAAQPADIICQIKDLSFIDNHKKKRLDKLNFTIRAGEIVGIAGVEGNGQFELVQVISGLIDNYQGEIIINNNSLKKLSILERRKLLAYVPQDRKNTGSAQALSLIENTIMTHHQINTRLTGKFDYLLNKKASRDLTREIIDDYQVLSSGPAAKISSLSGGNQQKLIVGREFAMATDFILLDNPTRGLDVGSIEFIQQQIIKSRDQGTAILLISADLDELFSLADRLVVIHQGRITAEKLPEATDKEEIGEYMLGARRDEIR